MVRPPGVLPLRLRRARAAAPLLAGSVCRWRGARPGISLPAPALPPRPPLWRPALQPHLYARISVRALLGCDALRSTHGPCRSLFLPEAIGGFAHKIADPPIA